MASFVYVLMHQTGQRFKIGKAVDIGARARQLGLTRFQTQGSFALHFETEQRSLGAERILHRVFADWRCSPQEVAQADGAGEGASEFFRVECYERLLHFIRSHHDYPGQGERL